MDTAESFKKPQAVYAGNARIVCNDGTPRHAKLTIGNVIIPFYELDIHMTLDEFVTIRAKVPADRVDVQALQQHTKLEIVETQKPTDK